MASMCARRRSGRPGSARSPPARSFAISFWRLLLGSIDSGRRPGSRPRQRALRQQAAPMPGGAPRHDRNLRGRRSSLHPPAACEFSDVSRVVRRSGCPVKSPDAWPSSIGVDLLAIDEDPGVSDHHRPRPASALHGGVAPNVDLVTDDLRHGGESARRNRPPRTPSARPVPTSAPPHAVEAQELPDTHPRPRQPGWTGIASRSGIERTSRRPATSVFRDHRAAALVRPGPPGSTRSGGTSSSGGAGRRALEVLRRVLRRARPYAKASSSSLVEVICAPGRRRRSSAWALVRFRHSGWLLKRTQ